MSMEIFNVSKFILSKNCLFYYSNGLLYKNDFVFYQPTKKRFFQFFVKGEELIVIDNRNTIFFSEKGYVISQVNLPILEYSYKNDFAFFQLDSDVGRDVYRRVFFSISANKEIREISNFQKIGKAVFLDKNLITNPHDTNDIIKISYEDTVVWQQALTYPPYTDYDNKKIPVKLERFIGVYEGILWVLFTGNRLVGLDVETGEARHEYIDLARTLELDGLALGDIHLDKANGKLKTLSYLYYIEIDLKRMVPEVRHYFGKGISDWRIGVSTFYEGDDNLYFIGANHIKKMNNILGVFDTVTCTVTWQYDIYPEDYPSGTGGMFVGSPQANDRYIGAQSMGGDLYLFERGKDGPARTSTPPSP